MEMKDQAAYESLRRKYVYLTTVLQPADMLPYLFASGLISVVQMQQIECAMHEGGPAQGSSKLLVMLMNNGSEGAFQKFLHVLQEISQLKYLVPELQSEFYFVCICITQLNPIANIAGYLTMRIRRYVCNGGGGETDSLVSIFFFMHLIKVSSHMELCGCVPL